MTISWLQAALLELFACLSSVPGLSGTTIGNYTFGRPLVGGLVCGLILGDVKTGIICGVAMQLVYTVLVTPGDTVLADVRVVSYIGVPLVMVAIHSQGLSANSVDAANLAKSMGTLAGTVGAVLLYGIATMNLVWQHIGRRAAEKGQFGKPYQAGWLYPWVSHLVFSFIPTLVTRKPGAAAVTAMKDALPMDGIPMKTLFTVGALLPCVGVTIPLKQIVEKTVDSIPFSVGSTLVASLGLNLVSCVVISLIFAILFYELEMTKTVRATATAVDDFDDDDEEDI